jgi:rare lipoprotein A (peptidoglycan hydrolase)
MKNKNKQANILMITLLFAASVIIATKAYERPFMPGCILYEPKKQKIEATEEKQAETGIMVVKEAMAATEGQILPKNEVIGIASWYDYKLNGENWSKAHRTCASRTLKRYSMARVTNMANGKSVECFVNDFGPEEWTSRQIDLSSFAFSQIADLKTGLANVKIEQL